MAPGVAQRDGQVGLLAPRGRVRVGVEGSIFE
jgi:hypothetical protein